MSILSKKTQLAIVGALILTLAAAAYMAHVREILMGLVTSRKSEPQNVQLWPLIDEDPVSAQRPLSEVLGQLDFIKDSDAMRTFNYTFRSRLRHRQFRDLDVFMDELRKGKARLPGGEWQLFTGYGLMSEPAAGWWAPDSDWDKHLHLIEDWVNAFPDSITARVTYANTFINYGWRARGQGFSNEVSQKQWDLFFDRHRKAQQVLIDANQLPVHCPQWYYLVLRIGLAFSWDRPEYDKIFNEAVAFEPLYNNYYAAKADFLLPRWHGREGEWQDFLVHAAHDVGGEEGNAILHYAFLYVAGFFDQTEWRANVRKLWPEIRRGYHATGALYGVSTDIINTHAKMAFTAGDRKEAMAAFETIGDSWDSTVWKSRDNFDQARQWAMNMAPGSINGR